jgi:thiol-disulfide isomerase/thioredoxin
MYRVFASMFLAAMTLSTAETGPDRLTDLEGRLKSHPNDLKLLEQYGREAREGFKQALSKGADSAGEYAGRMTTFLGALEPGDASARQRVADLRETAAFFGRFVRAGRCQFDQLRRDLTARPDDIETMLVYEIKIQKDYGALTNTDPDAAVDGLVEEKRFLASLRGRADEKVRKIVDVLCNGTIPRMEGRLEGALDRHRLIGQDAPALGDISAWVNGASVSEQQLRGKVVLLDFWAVWCVPCVEALPELRAWHEEFAGRGLVTIGVTGYYNYLHDESAGRPRRSDDHASPDREREMLAKFARQQRIPYPLAIEEGSSVSGKFKVEALPQIILIDRRGKVRSIRVGNRPDAMRELHSMIRKLLSE